MGQRGAKSLAAVGDDKWAKVDGPMGLKKSLIDRVVYSDVGEGADGVMVLLC